MPRKINLTFLIITLIFFAISSIVLYINYKDLGDKNIKYYRSTALVSLAEKYENKSRQNINLKYLDLKGKTHDIRYERTPINDIKYKVGDNVDIWINKFEYEDIIIENALEDQNKIIWLIFTASCLCLIGNIFWTQLKKILL